MERMNKIEKQANAFSYDIRLIREQAHREREEASKNGHAAVISAARRGARPFQKLVNSQIEKNKRDKALRERLLKEKRAEQTRSDRREDQLNRAMHLTRKQTTTVRKEHRNKKSVSAAFNFLQFMRPISSAFSSESLSSSGVRRSAADLDFVPTGKPSLVLSIADAHVSKFINNERSYLFQLDTEDGGHYLLQAPTQKDAIKWMETIGRSSQIAARRRLTWIGNSPKPQVMDHIPDRPAATSRDPRAGEPRKT
jgi:GTPase-activating protein BEM2